MHPRLFITAAVSDGRIRMGVSVACLKQDTKIFQKGLRKSMKVFSISSWLVSSEFECKFLSEPQFSVDIQK